jgi:glycosyltransferase involved in cell wall biosynthesis
MTRTLLAGLERRKGLEVKFLNTQVSRTLAEKGGKYQLRKSLRALAQTARLCRLILSFKPDLVYLPLTNSPSFLGFLRDAFFMVPALLFRKKIAFRLHGGYYFYTDSKGLKRKLVKALLGKTSLAMVQGSRLAEIFRGFVLEERIVVIPNGLDDGPFIAARGRIARREGPDGLKRVLFVGLMCPEKGFRDVIAAVPLVPGAQFVFMGEWPSPEDEREVMEFLRERGAAERVTFAGVVAGLAKYDIFATADIFVLPTYFVYEGHAVSSVEALAAGLPIVCTDHGALNESVRDGWNGFFVPRSDPEAIARRLNQLLHNDGLRRTMGERSRRLYEERFTLPKFVENWSRAIQRCAADQASPE